MPRGSFPARRRPRVAESPPPAREGGGAAAAAPAPQPGRPRQPSDRPSGSRGALVEPTARAGRRGRRWARAGGGLGALPARGPGARVGAAAWGRIPAVGRGRKSGRARSRLRSPTVRPGGGGGRGPAQDAVPGRPRLRRPGARIRRSDTRCGRHPAGWAPTGLRGPASWERPRPRRLTGRVARVPGLRAGTAPPRLQLSGVARRRGAGSGVLWAPFPPRLVVGGGAKG